MQCLLSVGVLYEIITHKTTVYIIYNKLTKRALSCILIFLIYLFYVLIIINYKL